MPSAREYRSSAFTPAHRFWVTAADSGSGGNALAAAGAVWSAGSASALPAVARVPPIALPLGPAGAVGGGWGARSASSGGSADGDAGDDRGEEEEEEAGGARRRDKKKRQAKRGHWHAGQMAGWRADGDGGDGGDGGGSAPASASKRFKAAWRTDEDGALAGAVTAGGGGGGADWDTTTCPPIKWTEIARAIGSARDGKQCRERWLNHLRPGIDRSPFTGAEDATLGAAVAQLGTRWVHIAALLPGRPENAVKNRWYSLQRSTVARTSGQSYEW